MTITAPAVRRAEGVSAGLPDARAFPEDTIIVERQQIGLATPGSECGPLARDGVR